MKEQAKQAAALGTGGLLGFLGYQVLELGKQNYELAQRVAKLEARAAYHHGPAVEEEAQAEEAAAASPLVAR
jgi:hypothetical protein